MFSLFDRGEKWHVCFLSSFWESNNFIFVVFVFRFCYRSKHEAASTHPRVLKCWACAHMLNDQPAAAVAKSDASVLMLEFTPCRTPLRCCFSFLLYCFERFANRGGQAALNLSRLLGTARSVRSFFKLHTRALHRITSRILSAPGPNAFIC